MSKRKIIKKIDLVIENYDVPTEGDNGLEVLPCRPQVEIDHDLNRVKLTMTDPPKRKRNDKWFEVESPYGKFIVMSRQVGASITLSLNPIEMKQYQNAVQLLGQQFQTSLCMAIAKICKSNIKIQPDEN